MYMYTNEVNLLCTLNDTVMHYLNIPLNDFTKLTISKCIHISRTVLSSSLNRDIFITIKINTGIDCFK